MIRIFLKWLPFAVVTTGMCLLIYGAEQQNFRLSLNDPQIQMAEDGAALLAGGALTTAIVPRTPLVDADASLAPFIAVFDSEGLPLESSGTVNGAPPKPPVGVFAAAQNDSGKGTTQPYENRVSWQPSGGTRIALVVKYVPGTKQFVAAGRNMREVEAREAHLHSQMLLAWIVTLFVSFGTVAFASRRTV